MESRKHQRDPEGSRNLPSVEARRPSGAAERDYSFRIRPGLRAQNFTLHGRLQVQPQPSAASIFLFPPWVLAISCEVGIKVANDTKWGRERAAKNSSSAEVLLLILQDGQGASHFLWSSFRFTGAFWAIEHGQGRKAWRPQTRPRGLLVSQGLVIAH